MALNDVHIRNGNKDTPERLYFREKLRAYETSPGDPGAKLVDLNWHKIRDETFEVPVEEWGDGFPFPLPFDMVLERLER